MTDSEHAANLRKAFGLVSATQAHRRLPRLLRRMGRCGREIDRNRAAGLPIDGLLKEAAVLIGQQSELAWLIAYLEKP